MGCVHLLIGSKRFLLKLVDIVNFNQKFGHGCNLIVLMFVDLVTCCMGFFVEFYGCYWYIEKHGISLDVIKFKEV